MRVLRRILSEYKVELAISAVLVLAYFFLRLYQIMSLPIFTDEAIYVRWSQIARFDPAWRFISLTDGKQPLFVWIAMNIMRIVSDPLFASRLVSVFAGLFTMIGLFFLGNELFKNKWVGFVSAFLYLIFPFALVYDRMALYDSLVGVFTIWGLYFEVLLIRKFRLDIALVLGMIIGGGILTKTSAFFTIYLAPTLLLLFDFKNKNRLSVLLKWIVLISLSIFFAYAYYSVLRLSPFHHIINEKNGIFVYTFKEWLSHPITYIGSNLKGLSDWLISYMTWSVAFLIIASFFINKKFLKEKILLLIWFLVPFVGLVFFGKTLYPRFIFFMTLFLLPLAAFSIFEIYQKIKNKTLSTVIIFAFLIPFLRADFFIISDFAKAPIAKPDLSQYINDWPAGGGVNEVIDYLGNQASGRKIYVASLGTFGSLPTYAVEIYLGDNRNVDKRGIFPVPTQIPEDLTERAKEIPVYVFVSNQTEFEKQISTWPLELVMKIPKGTGKSFTWLYKVKSS